MDTPLIVLTCWMCFCAGAIAVHMWDRELSDDPPLTRVAISAIAGIAGGALAGFTTGLAAIAIVGIVI